MKIVQVTPLYPPHIGGVENVAKEISERLAKKGHQVEVFTSDIVGYKKREKLKDKKNIKIHYLRNWKCSSNPIIAPFLFNKLQRISQDSIIHVHVAQAIFPEIVYLTSKMRRIPYIAQIHVDIEPSSFLGKIFLNPYKTIFLKRFLKNSSKIIVLTEDYKQLISSKYLINKNKIIVIPNGVGEEFFTDNKIKNKITHLLYVGRISIEKNISRLVESVALCESKFVLDIVGDGELLEEIKGLVKQKNLNNIIFHGRKTGKNLLKIYKNADILILPSRKESFGLVLLEAMATKTPIIASDIPGIRSIVKNNYNGILVEPTPEKIAEAIEKLIKNPKLREKLAKNGLKEVKKYSWDKIVEQTEKVYEEVLRENNKKQKRAN